MLSKTTCLPHDLKILLPFLGQLKFLRCLALADSSCLGVGFHPPRCGNVYMGPHGDEVRKQVQAEGHEADQKVARMVFATCLELETLWVGDFTKFTVDRATGKIIYHKGERLDKVVHYPEP